MKLLRNHKEIVEQLVFLLYIMKINQKTSDIKDAIIKIAS